MTFKELAKLGQEQLAKQKPVTLAQARAQAQRVQERIEGKVRKEKTSKDVIQRKSKNSNRDTG